MGVKTYYSYHPSQLGILLMESDGEFLTRLSFVDSIAFEETNLSVFDATKSWLDVYFKKEDPRFYPAIKVDGTSFQKEVWKILLSIPYGETMTYGQIVKRLNRKKISAQAVGQAVGKNPIVLMIPCHRVLGKDQKITGYAYGIQRKIDLLDLEGYDVSKIKY